MPKANQRGKPTNKAAQKGGGLEFTTPQPKPKNKPKKKSGKGK